MDSAKLLEMVAFYEKRSLKNEKISIDSITIVRNGYIVADVYLNPLFPKDTKHMIHSCTKSIMSSLIGIAIEEGYIEGIDARIKTLALKDLLAMRTGLHSQDSYRWKKGSQYYGRGRSFGGGKNDVAQNGHPMSL